MFFGPPPGPYDFPGKSAQSFVPFFSRKNYQGDPVLVREFLFRCFLFRTKIIRGPWYWYTNFSSLISPLGRCCSPHSLKVVLAPILDIFCCTSQASLRDKRNRRESKMDRSKVSLISEDFLSN